MAKSNPVNPLAKETDPYLSLNDKLDTLVSDVETLAEAKKGDAPFEPSLLRALLDVMKDMRKAIGTRDAPVIQVQPATVELKPAQVSVNIDTAKEWDVKVTERDEGGRIKRMKFTAV